MRRSGAPVTQYENRPRAYLFPPLEVPWLVAQVTHVLGTSRLPCVAHCHASTPSLPEGLLRWGHPAVNFQAAVEYYPR